MKCPKCHEDTCYDLFETADDYQDGIIVCNNCGEEIATFIYNFVNLSGDNEKAEDL